MKLLTKGLYAAAGAAAAFVAGSSVMLAIRQGSWAPIASVAWIPAVVLAAWPGGRRRCLPGRAGRLS